MNEKEAIDALKYTVVIFGRSAGKTVYAGALEKAINALETQIKLKEYIERINQPEYQDLTWSKQELVLLLYELVAE